MQYYGTPTILDYILLLTAVTYGVLLSSFLHHVVYVSVRSLIHPKAFIPVHLFGQLVQHEEGCIRVDREVCVCTHVFV